MAELKLIETHCAPDIFADRFTGSQPLNDAVRLTFDAVRCDHSAPGLPSVRVVVGHLVLPIGAARQMAEEIIRHTDLYFAQAEANQVVKN